jgi:hypothetical protein
MSKIVNTLGTCEKALPEKTIKRRPERFLVLLRVSRNIDFSGKTLNFYENRIFSQVAF